MNQLEKTNEPIYYWDFTEGDYNDVYQRKILKGTWDQVQEYCKSFLTEEGLERAESNSGNDISYEIYYENEKDEEGNELEDQELRVEYYVSAGIYNDVNDFPSDIKESDVELDLTKEVDQ